MTASLDTSLACIILAAGKGTRMKSALPKVMHRLAGRTLVGHVLDAVRALEPERCIGVIGPDMEMVADEIAPAEAVIQPGQRGTGDAVRPAADALGDFSGDVLVLFGDTPLVRPETLARMVAARRASTNPGIVVMGMRCDDPTGYGRLVTDDDGQLQRIVEDKDADAQERAITLCNAGIMAIDGACLAGWLARLGCDNAQGEYYLTDLPALARADGRGVSVVEAGADEVLGINNREQLAAAEAVMQARLRKAAMAGGATLTAPETVFLCADTVLGQDVVIGPHVVFGPGVAVADRVEIRAFSHLEGVNIRTGAVVGPYARLRPGADVGEGARIGNFVEVKQATIGPGAKVNHLSYVGDATVGPGANIGAGTITCNYDGFLKHHTGIGAGAFIGSNTALVAPVEIGDGAIVGAGSTITRDVPANAVALERSQQTEKQGMARAFRERKAREKARRRDTAA